MDQNDYLGQKVIRDPIKSYYKPLKGFEENNNEYSPAGFFIRLLARILDYLILATLSYLILLSFQDAKGLIANLVFVFFYYIIVIPFMISSGYRGSLGKLLCGLAIERENGARLGFFRALAREILFSILWMFTFIVVFSKRKLTIQDMILDTKVVRKPNSKRFLIPALLLAVALGTLVTGMKEMYSEKIPGIAAELYFNIQDKFDIKQKQPETIHMMHQDLNLNNAKPVHSAVRQNHIQADDDKITEGSSPIEDLNFDEIGYLAVGSKTLNIKDYFVKVVDIHNQGLEKKLVPSNYWLQVALYDRKLSSNDRKHLSKIQNLVEGSNSAAVMFAIQITDRLNKCTSSNYRTAKIQVKKVAAGYSNVFTPHMLLEKRHLMINCSDFRDGTELIFKMQNSFYRNVGSEIEVNVRLKARINQ